jgi:hypothetical protein
VTVREVGSEEYRQDCCSEEGAAKCHGRERGGYAEASHSDTARLERECV